MPPEILAPQDATLWWVQPAEAPLQIGSLCLFEGAPLRDRAGRLRMDVLRRHVTDRLASSPRFRQRLVTLPLDRGVAWADDEHFDIHRHIRRGRLPAPGGDAELRALVAALIEEPLDPDHPLWQIWVVDGVADDRVAVIVKVNHVMADGLALLQFSFSLLDTTPRPRRARSVGGASAHWVPDPLPNAPSLLVSGAVERARHQLRAVQRIASGVLDPRVLAGSVASLWRLGRSDLAPAPALPITGAVGWRRDFAWARLPWADLQRAKEAEATTMNDVVLCITTGALDHYLARDGHRITGRDPRVLVPVSTHGTSATGEIDNRFSMLVARLPLTTADPIERLRMIHAEMDRHKRSPQRALGSLLFSVGDLVPPWVLRAAAPTVLRNQPFVNLAVSNLPGTRDPLYLLGSEMLELYPFISGIGNLAVIVGVLSYGDALGVGITVDTDVIPDAEVLATGMEQAARELIDAVDGTRRRPSRRPARERRRA